MVKLPQGGYLNNTYSNKTLVLPFPILNKIQVSYLTSKRKKGSNKTKRHPPLHYPDWIHVSCDTSKTLDTSTNSTIQHWCCWRLARRKTSDEQTGRQLYTPIQKPGANHLWSSTNQPITLSHHSLTPFTPAGPQSLNQTISHTHTYHSVTQRGKKPTRKYTYDPGS